MRELPPSPPPPSPTRPSATPADGRIVAADRGPDPAGRFGPEERAIFDFGLGGLRGDPLAIERRLDAAMAEIDREVLGQWLSDRAATRRLLGLSRLEPALRAAFGLPRFREGGGGGYAAAEVLAVHARFQGYRDEVAARWRAEAEYAATYGPEPGDPAARSYERRVGLWWNRGRVQALAAVATWRGAGAASGRGPLPSDLVDATCSTRSEAVELAASLESERTAAENRARSGST